MIHIKDVISCWENKKIGNIKKLIREILFAPHSMSVLDLLLKMRTSHIHMAVIVDEHGGLDGLVTIEDLVEEIVGEIKDEHEAQKESKKNKDKLNKDEGSVKISSRMPIEEFEKKYGINFSDKEDISDIDTMGGLVFHIFGRVPLKGESIKHLNGCEFEILDADSRRIRTILVRNHIFE
jgi:CBS domain containing-hemolysin-like protein